MILTLPVSLPAIVPLTWRVHLLIHQISVNSCPILPGDASENRTDPLPALMDHTYTIRSRFVWFAVVDRDRTTQEVRRAVCGGV